jgi:V8-like Glu-specific endopeptidase
MSRNHSARIRAGLVAAAMAAVALGAGATAAGASPSQTTGGGRDGVAVALREDRSVSTHPGLNDEAARGMKGSGVDAQRAALTRYWTPQRMRAAKVAEGQPGMAAARSRTALAHKQELASLKAGTRPEVPAKRAGRMGPKKPARPAARQAGWVPNLPSNHPVARTYGKVFFTNTSNGLNYVCSGTVVNSEGRDTVWTAGHCVHGGAGGSWHANWVFVPAYSHGNAPYGVWSAGQLWTTNGWVGSSDLTRDVGVAIIGTVNGQHIVDVLGGQGIAWNYSKYYYSYSFGYPAASPYDGEELIGCDGSAEPEWVFLWWSANTLKMPCDMTGGSSGGAWLRWFDGNYGYINGVNSYKYDDDSNTMYSPYFGDAVANLYNAVRYL